MQPIPLEGQYFELTGTQCGASTCADSKSTCRRLSFILPCAIVIIMSTVANWLDTPLFSMSSILCALQSSILPGLIAGVSGFLLYAGIKSAKRQLRAVSIGGQSKCLSARNSVILDERADKDLGSQVTKCTKGTY